MNLKKNKREYYFFFVCKSSDLKNANLYLIERYENIEKLMWLSRISIHISLNITLNICKKQLLMSQVRYDSKDIIQNMSGIANGTFLK